jgi:hypothetical protein
MSNMKRVYHPHLDSWTDVPAEDVDKWAEAGWRKTQPKHVNTDDAPEVGEHPGIASVPVLTSAAPVTTTSTGGTTSTTTSGGSSAR